MADPRLTVLMPVYNGERFLEQALDSILGQTWGDFRLFVCNDGSTDGTAEILARCGDPRLRVFEQENRGVVQSLNRMLQAAGTELVARHDADDVSRPERFARQVAHLDAHPEVGLLGSYACKISEAGEEVGCITPHVAHEDIVRCLPNYNQFVHGSVMMRRQACERAGGYAPVFTHAEDYELWFRLTRVTRAANLPEKLYGYRLHGGQILSLQGVEQQRIRDFVGRFSMNNAYDALMDGDRRGEPRSLYLVDDRSALPVHGVGLAVEDAEAIGLHLDRALELFEPDEVVLSARHDGRCLDLVRDRAAACPKRPAVRDEQRPFSPTVDLMIEQKTWNEIDRENERDGLSEYVEQARALREKRNRTQDLMTDAVLEAVPVGGKVVILGDDVLADDAAALCAKLKAEVLATATELPADGSAPDCVREHPGAVILVAELAGQGGFGALLAGQGLGFTDVLRALRDVPAGPGEANPEITAVICRTDEETFEDCLASLERQTMRPGRIEVVDNVTPMHRAFNEMLERATTRYYLHVDADMVLAPDCVETLYGTMRKNEDCFLARAYLKDDLLGRIPFVKLFDRERVGDVRYRDTIGCDRDFEGRIMDKGYAAVIVERVLGRHISGRSARAVFLKYKRSMEKCRSLNDPVEVYTKPFFENAVKRRPAMALYALAGFFSGMHSAGDEFQGERDGERADRWLEAARACLDDSKTGKSLSAEQAHYFRGVGMHHMAVAGYAAALKDGAVTVEDARSYLARLDAEAPGPAQRLAEVLANHPAEAGAD